MRRLLPAGFLFVLLCGLRGCTESPPASPPAQATPEALSTPEPEPASAPLSLPSSTPQTPISLAATEPTSAPLASNEPATAPTPAATSPSREPPRPLQPPAAKETPKESADPPPPPLEMSPTEKYGALLTRYVSGGRVDYDGLQSSRADLDAFVSFVASHRGKKLSFYINAYNALVLAALLDNNLPAKVTDVKGFFDAKKYTIAGKSQTLNDLETEIRTTYKDARIHFALNCGARSCPPLLNRVFTEGSLEKTLDTLTNRFLNGSGVKIDEAKKQIQVTRLMDWYGQDFKDEEGSIEKYLKKYISDPDKKAALEAALLAGYKISFQGYNWAINKK